MILKNFINLFNLTSLFLMLLYIYILNIFLTTTDIRKKFFLFIINLLIIVGIGFYYSLDGLVMMFFISELTIILIFVILFSQLYTYYKSKQSKSYFSFIWLAILLTNLIHQSTELIEYKNYYNFLNITLNDFYYIYNTYFEKYLLLTIFMLFIITLYSIFFILVYYSLKEKSALELKKKQSINLLRKQNIIHQNNYNTKIRIFKNKF